MIVTVIVNRLRLDRPAGRSPHPSDYPIFPLSASAHMFPVIKHLRERKAHVTLQLSSYSSVHESDSVIQQ